MKSLNLQLTIASSSEVFDTPDKAGQELSRLFYELSVKVHGLPIRNGVIILYDLNGSRCGDVDIKYEPVNE